MNDKTHDPLGDSGTSGSPELGRAPDVELDPGEQMVAAFLREVPADMDTDRAEQMIASVLALSGSIDDGDRAPVVGIADHTPRRTVHRISRNVVGLAAMIVALIVVSISGFVALRGSRGSSEVATQSADAAGSANATRDAVTDSSSGVTADGVSGDESRADNTERGVTTTSPTAGAPATRLPESPEKVAPNEGGSGVSGGNQISFAGAFPDVEAAVANLNQQVSTTDVTHQPSAGVASCSDQLTSSGSHPLSWITVGGVEAIVVGTPSTGESPSASHGVSLIRADTCSEW